MKKIVGVIAAVVMMSPLIAMADDFVVYNGTRQALSFNGQYGCSAEFGSIAAYSWKTVAAADFQQACRANLHYCMMTVHAGDHCEGETIATVMFDTDVGLTSVLNGLPNYSFTYNKNNMAIVQGL